LSIAVLRGRRSVVAACDYPGVSPPLNIRKSEAPGEARAVPGDPKLTGHIGVKQVQPVWPLHALLFGEYVHWTPPQHGVFALQACP
jgi:hypothetical protein